MYKTPLQKETQIKIYKPVDEWAHENYPWSKYAIDFMVPKGTPVLSARGGKVVRIKQDSDKWGLDKKFLNDANYVTIKHEDGTYAEYLHLEKNKIKVKKGDSVSQGDLLGYVGLSGAISEPHLHFHVFELINEKPIGLEVKFD